jgi:CubicO group peptidase (beta-lactamase class C family)
MVGYDPFKTGKPEEVGLSTARLEHAQNLLAGWAADGSIPGAALCVARRGVVVVQRGFGQYTPLEPTGAAPQPVQAETIFLIASLTKPVVATAAMLLVERGRLLLEDMVSALLPEFGGEDRQKTRVLHLLTHTSGLPDMLPQNVALRQEHAPCEEFVRRTCSTPLLFAPGKECRYQSMGIALLGAIIERLSGQPLRSYMQREILAPLGMADSFLGLGALSPARTAQVVLSPEEQALDWTWNSAYWRDLGAPWGGMHATVGDYARILQAFLEGGSPILSRNTVQTMLANHIATMPSLAERLRLEQGWGLGWRLNVPRGAHGLAELASPRTFGHAGATGTTAWADPETGLVCVLFTTQPTAGRKLNMISNAIAAAVVS